MLRRSRRQRIYDELGTSLRTVREQGGSDEETCNRMAYHLMMVYAKRDYWFDFSRFTDLYWGRTKNE